MSRDDRKVGKMVYIQVVLSVELMVFAKVEMKVVKLVALSVD